MKKIWFILGCLIFILVLLLGLYLNHLDVKNEELISEKSNAFMIFKNSYDNRETLKKLGDEFEFDNRYLDYVKEIFLIQTDFKSKDYRKEYILGFKAGFLYPALYYPVFKYCDLRENGIFKLKKSIEIDGVLEKDENVYIKFYRGYLFFSTSLENIENYVKDIENRKLNIRLAKRYKMSRKTGLINGFVDLEKIFKKEEKFLKSIVLYENNEKKIKTIGRYFDKLGVMSFDYSYLPDKKKVYLDMTFDFKGKIMKMLDSGEKTLTDKITLNSVYISSKSFRNIADVIFNDYKEQGLQYDVPYMIFTGEDPRDTAENIGNELLFYIGENLNEFSALMNLRDRDKLITVLERIKGIAKIRKLDDEYIVSRDIKLSLDSDKFYVNKDLAKKEFIKTDVMKDELLYSVLDLGIIDDKYKGIDLSIRAKKDNDVLKVRLSSDLEKLKKILYIK